MTRQHAVFAVIAPELGEESHRFLGTLFDQLAEHQCIAWAKAARWASISGGNRSRTETSRANQRV